MRFLAAALLTASALACGGRESSIPTAVATPTPTPSPTPLVSAACSTALLACGGGKTYCVSLRYAVGSVCRESGCLESLATTLRNNAVSTTVATGPDWEMGSQWQPGCVGTRPDIGGTPQEAECLVELLNAIPSSGNYTVDQTRCNVDGFPHMIVAR
jgi:hypothetical protein